MSYPTVVGFSHGTVATTVATVLHELPIPSGSVGELLVIAVVQGRTVNAFTWPAGWTVLTDTYDFLFVTGKFAVAVRVADGTEGATVPLSVAGGGDPTSYHAYRIAGFSGIPAVTAVWTGGAVTAPNPDNLATGFGVADTLWIAGTAWSNGTVTATGYPTSYTNGSYDAYVNTAGGAIATARRTTTASSEDPGPFALSGGGSIAGTFVLGIAGVTVPVPDPIITPPVDIPPSNAVIEIRAAAVSASRWGQAVWGPPSVWAAAGWVDVTPQSVDATVRWGSHQPEAGILGQTEAGSWVVDTYDPDRLLDPGNTDSPYHADLRAGLPIRIRHRGTIVRQGICEIIAYYHADKRGGIRVTDNISTLARSLVPESSDLSDTLRARARDAISAAGLAVTVEPDPPSGDPALVPRLAGSRSVWRHIADAAEQVLHVAYVDRLGTVRFRPWDTPYDRARGVDSTQLVDLGTIVQTSGLYSIVQAQQTAGDGGLLITRALTPKPRYGSVTYSRTDETPDAEAWADAVLADRSLQTVQWIPGEIYPLTADDVEYFATLEGMERFGVDYIEAVPPVDISGIIVGGEFTVRSKKESQAVWSFQLELAQTADSPLYTDEDPGEFLLNDPGDGYLYAD